MIFEFYEQQDLFKIANCARRQALVDWLNINSIPFSQDSKGKILAHSSAVAGAFGVSEDPVTQLHTTAVELNLE